MGLQAQFRTFNKTISMGPNDTRLSEARDKRQSIDKEIKAKFKENNWGDAPTFLQGSYATGMAIVPLDGDYDIDVAVTIPSDLAPDSPIPVKRAIKSVFDDRGLSAATIKRPCVTAQYMKDGKPKFHIDYPVYRISNSGTHELGWGKPTSTTEDKKWSEGDPKGLVEWSKNNDLDSDARDQYRCLVRFLKRWRDLRYSSIETKPFSIGLTIMIRECFLESFNDDGEADDLGALINTINKILSHGYFIPTGDEKYDLVVKLPKSPYVDVFNSHGNTMGTKLFNRLNQLKKRLIAAQDKATTKAACKILAEDNVFGSDFPVPEDGDGNGNSSRKVKTINGGAVGSPQGA
ncbi:MAG: nucleotidyltransferase [Cellvibrionaceae bacterium]